MSREISLVEIFKTNVQEVDHAKVIVDKLHDHYPNTRINFALDDCDKILRVEGAGVCRQKIIEVLNQLGFAAEILV
ncbi:MAG: hypothetical protein ABL895_05945 [Cyclobacteriaceae bacterium]